MTAGYPVDLHLHSRFSDGLLTPEALAEEAKKRRLRLIALCDHDTTAGLTAMAQAVAAVNRQEGEPLYLIPSIELSAGLNAKTHLLGYGLNPDDPALQACLTAAREDRRERLSKMLALLEDQGVTLSPENRAALNVDAAGRAHVARALIRQGVVNTMAQAFQRYLGEGKCAYVPRKTLPATQAVALLKSAGAIPVLAHPCRLALENAAFQALLEALKEAGLQGLEAYHPSAAGKEAQRLARLARQTGLLVTGGSDFHGDPHARVAMGRMPSGWQSCLSDAQALYARAVLKA